MSPNRALIQIE